MPPVLDVSAIEKSLRLDSQQTCGRLAWLEDSYQDPNEFWRLLKNTFDAHVASTGASAPFSRYNFYHDIIVRNLNNPAPALCWHELATGFRNISYRELGQLATLKEKSWDRHGVRAGQTLCIVRPMCLDLVVETLAALKAGCVVAFLVPQGKRFLQKRLEMLQPDHIVIDAMQLHLLSRWSGIALTESGLQEDVNPERVRSFAYPSGQIVFRSFDPSVTDMNLPVDITSDAAYLSALRDGMIVLGLGPGHVYAAPGFHFAETYPFLLLAGLLCGATYLHVSPKAVAENADLVLRQPMRVFGVSKKVRDILLEKQVEINDIWECWFRNPAETMDLEQWHYFIRNLKLEKAYAFNLRWDAASGGCSLFSVRRRGMAHLNVMPVPGVSWSLEDVSGGGAPSAEAGLFALSAPGAPAEDDKRITTSIVVKNRYEGIFAGINGPHREGRIYPIQEVLDALQPMETRYDVSFSLVDFPAVDFGSGYGARMILLVFFGAKADVDKAGLSARVRTVISQDMGDEFQPDEIRFFPLYARTLPDMETDHEWCRQQYLSGSLFRKSRGEVFHYITGLRGSLIKIS